MAYPPIEPSTYDLIVVGTGLPESIIAAAASAAGKSVLHLDPNSFYGSHFSSLTLDELAGFLTSEPTVTSVTPSDPQCLPPSTTDDSDLLCVDILNRPMYHEVEITFHSSQPSEKSRKFNIDVAGPRVLYCADSSIDLMQKSGTSQYLEFKSVDASFVCGSDGKLSTVPDSRAAIFKDGSLSLIEKNQLMKIFKIVQRHLASKSGNNDENSRISDQDLESPFVDYLQKLRLPPKIKSYRSHCPFLCVNYDQQNIEGYKEVLQTKDGITRLALYHQSVGRESDFRKIKFPWKQKFYSYPNGRNGLFPRKLFAFYGFMVPKCTWSFNISYYGQGELPQGFCHRAAVKGSIYGDRHYKGVRLASGQDVFSRQLLLGPSFVPSSTLEDPLPPNLMEENSLQLSPGSAKRKIARGICIASSSLKADLLNILLIYPPRALYPAQATSIRVLQIGSDMAVCPSGMFVIYISALSNNASEGKKLLHATANALFSQHSCEEVGLSSCDGTEELKPKLLWSALYLQDLSNNMGSFDGTVGCSFMPNGSLNYNDVINETVKLFKNMYPDEEFFPEEPREEEEDGSLALDS